LENECEVFFIREPKGRDFLGDAGVSGRIILKYVVVTRLEG
jgi:hypothetical protein